jgi:MraZ protein
VGRSGAPGNRRAVVNGVLEQMFLGQYRHTLDDKGRLTIPSRFRTELSNGAYLTQGFDRNLRLMTEQAFGAVYAKLSQMNTTDPVARELRRLIFASASQVDLDSVGRILIPQFLRGVAALERDAVIVGVGEVVEVWSPEAWDSQVTQLSDVDANSQRFIELDL